MSSQPETVSGSDSPVRGNTSHQEQEPKVGLDVEAINRGDTDSHHQKIGFAAPAAPVGDDKNVVDFDGPDDPERPLNWPMRKKLLTTILYSFTTMGGTWASTM
jgi:hypothetical protein